jgi:hypothetical protein
MNVQELFSGLRFAAEVKSAGTTHQPKPWQLCTVPALLVLTACTILLHFSGASVKAGQFINMRVSKKGISTWKGSMVDRVPCMHTASNRSRIPLASVAKIQSVG